MELEYLRGTLLARRTEWTAIAVSAGVHRKSIERMCLHGQIPRYRTIQAIWAIVFAPPPTRRPRSPNKPKPKSKRSMN